jgi:hypothetical protein
MKVSAVQGVTSAIALDSRHPDQQSKEETAPYKHELVQALQQDELEDGVMHQLPLATSGALGTRLNVVV